MQGISGLIGLRSLAYLATKPQRRYAKSLGIWGMLGKRTTSVHEQVSCFAKSVELISDWRSLYAPQLVYDVRLATGNAAGEGDGWAQLGAGAARGRWHWLLHSTFPSQFLIKSVKSP